VKISFGELRQAAPAVFSSDNDLDYIQVSLPLNEILLRINPALLVRRQNQKQVQIPEDIRSPFGSRGDGLIFSVGPTKAEPTASQPPAPRRSMAPTAPIQPSPISPKATPFAPVTRATAVPPKPAPPASVPQPTPVSPAFVPPTRQPGPPPASPATHGLRDAGVVPHEFTAPRMPAAPREAAPQPVRPTGEGASLSVSLIALIESWPEAVRQEIAQQNLTEARIALPTDTVEQSLKRGKVVFPWKMLRSWIRPAPLPSVSAHDNAMLELPLRVIAPLFLNRHKDAFKSQQKVAVDENIPNLFFGFPQPSSPPEAETTADGSHAVAKPVDTNYYVWDDDSDSAKVDETEFKRKADVSPGTSFISRCATPNEVVSRAAALEGVAGALIALPDGLMVASRLAPDLNGDTLAAFLPHIFGKVSQCTRELRMGELNNLNFTVGNVPWKIFRVNAIFFAAFGRPGQPLPTGQLAALAAELDRKKQ
jgi:predicted regulator of Ras-like GTPase activity (Roadblock/LC7/MglB family)